MADLILTVIVLAYYSWLSFHLLAVLILLLIGLLELSWFIGMSTDVLFIGSLYSTVLL